MRTQYIGRVERKAALRAARLPRISFHWLSAFARRANCWAFGGATPRQATRREFPEVEFHQVLTGKKDYFDQLR